MTDIIFEVIKISVMIAALLLARYVVPWFNELIQDVRMKQVISWAQQGVLAAQQVHSAESGKDRKDIVTKFLKEILAEKNLALSDEQIDTLIEAAVKQMKIEQEKAEAGKKE